MITKTEAPAGGTCLILTRYSVYVSVSQLVALYDHIEVDAKNEDEARDIAVEKIEGRLEFAPPQKAKHYERELENFPDGAEGVADLLVQAESVEKI